MHKKQCHELLTSLSDYIDGTLDNTVCEEIEKHLAKCPDCNVVLNTIRKTIDLYHRVDEDTSIPVDARHRLHVRLELQNLGHQ